MDAESRVRYNTNFSHEQDGGDIELRSEKMNPRVNQQFNSHALSQKSQDQSRQDMRLTIDNQTDRLRVQNMYVQQNFKLNPENRQSRANQSQESQMSQNLSDNHQPTASNNQQYQARPREDTRQGRIFESAYVDQSDSSDDEYPEVFAPNTDDQGNTAYGNHQDPNHATMTSKESVLTYLIVDIYEDKEENSENQNILTSTIITEKCVLKKIDKNTALIFYSPNLSGEEIDIGYVLQSDTEPIPKSWIMYRAQIIMRCIDMELAKYFIINRDSLDQYIQNNPAFDVDDLVLVIYDENAKTVEEKEGNTDILPTNTENGFAQGCETMDTSDLEHKIDENTKAVENLTEVLDKFLKIHKTKPCSIQELSKVSGISFPILDIDEFVKLEEKLKSDEFLKARMNKFLEINIVPKNKIQSTMAAILKKFFDNSTLQNITASRIRPNKVLFKTTILYQLIEDVMLTMYENPQEIIDSVGTVINNNKPTTNNNTNTKDR
ncbi:hypothetical protein QAD02_002832 [Eretmocerus hayati]|uniref:Uncharacterized protein n=1 Tax=Eretmocerus hayati TaxID=131215 RepID=A0ACC2NK62_9HYME|nr:hypothetical protein QAD02_002832 [Eretmocerus hayati]